MSDHESIKLDVGNCPLCNGRINGHASTPFCDGKPTPTDGDVTVCVYCVKPLLYRDRKDGEGLEVIPCLVDLLEQPIRGQILSIMQTIGRFKSLNPDAFQGGHL